MFPVSNKSQDVVDVLINQLKENHVEIKEETPVVSVSYDHNFKVKTQIGEFESHSLIIATGGTSVPQTGSTGDGYKFAKSLGHSITELFPTEVPITSSETFIKSNRLKGLSLKDVNLSVLKKNGKKSKSSNGYDIHILELVVLLLLDAVSLFIKSRKIKKKNIQMQLDVFPELNVDQLFQKVRKYLKQNQINILKIVCVE